MTNKKDDYNTLLRELDAQISMLEKMAGDVRQKIADRILPPEVDTDGLDMAIELLREQRSDIVKRAEEASRNSHIVELKVDGILYRLDAADGDTVSNFLTLTKGMEVAEDMSPSQKVREWLLLNNYSVGARGKIPGHLQAKYDAAHAETKQKAQAKKGPRHATVTKELQAA